jgi:hypothetical protein
MTRRKKTLPRLFEVNSNNQLAIGEWSSAYAFTDGAATCGITCQDLKKIVIRLNNPMSVILDNGVLLFDLEVYIKSLKQEPQSFLRFLLQLKAQDDEYHEGDLMDLDEFDFEYNPVC